MFRARIPLAMSVLVIVATAVVFQSINGALVSHATHGVEALVGRAQSAFPKLELLRGIDVTNETARFASEETFAQIFDKTGEEATRSAAYDAVTDANKRLAEAGRKADLVAVVGANGHVIVRDLNPNVLVDEDWKSKYPLVGRALGGSAFKDTWNFDGHMYRVAAAPIRGKTGQILGALIIGSSASASDAVADRERIGTEVAYFLDHKIEASSFKKEGGESAEEKALAVQIFDDKTKLADEALAGKKAAPFTVKLGGEDFLVQVGPLPGNLTKSASGYVVLASLTQAQALTAGLPIWILVLGAIGLLAVIGGVTLTSLRFIQPLDAIERGVAEVINGNQDYVFQSATPDFEGLANGVNVMLARLLGRPDPTDDELVSAGGAAQRWQGELSVEDSGAAAPAAQESEALGKEPEGAYLQRLFGEYLAARKQNGENVNGLTLADFSAKIRQNEAGLKRKYNCRLVRFKISIKNKQTALKPVPIQ